MITASTPSTVSSFHLPKGLRGTVSRDKVGSCRTCRRRIQGAGQRPFFLSTLGVFLHQEEYSGHSGCALVVKGLLVPHHRFGVRVGFPPSPGSCPEGLSWAQNVGGPYLPSPVDLGVYHSSAHPGPSPRPLGKTVKETTVLDSWHLLGLWTQQLL